MLEIVADRNNTNSVKFDGLEERFPPIKGLIPMWIADMDYRCPECVKTAISKLAEETRRVESRLNTAERTENDALKALRMARAKAHFLPRQPIPKRNHQNQGNIKSDRQSEVLQSHNSNILWN